MVFTPPTPQSQGNQSNTGANSGNTDAVWMPKWPDSIFVNTSTMQGVANASDNNSPTYNYTSSSTNAQSEYGSGAGYMTADMSSWINSVAKSIHPMKTGKSLWEEAVAASKSLWENHQERKTPYQIISEWSVGASQGGSGSSGGGGGGGGGSAGPVAPNPDTIRRAMNSVTMGLLGRQLSEKEFNRFYGQYKAEFASTGGNMDVEQTMIDRARQDTQYQEYQVATKFASALDSVLRGAA